MGLGLGFGFGFGSVGFNVVEGTPCGRGCARQRGSRVAQVYRNLLCTGGIPTWSNGAVGVLNVSLASMISERPSTRLEVATTTISGGNCELRHPNRATRQVKRQARLEYRPGQMKPRQDGHAGRGGAGTGQSKSSPNQSSASGHAKVFRQVSGRGRWGPSAAPAHQNFFLVLILRCP